MDLVACEYVFLNLSDLEHSYNCLVRKVVSALCFSTCIIVSAATNFSIAMLNTGRELVRKRGMHLVLVSDFILP